MKRGALIFFVLIISVVWATPVRATDIDVELVWRFAQPGWLQITIEQGSYRCTVAGSAAGQSSESSLADVSVAAGEVIQLGWGGWTPIWRLNQGNFAIAAGVISLDGQGNGCLEVLRSDGVSALYRGSLRMQWQAGHWRLINRLDGEEYLFGVVPSEMSNAWAVNGLEALKAQAVAARTFMVRSTQGARMITDSPDIDQAYGGKSVEGAATQAVEETRSLILADADSAQPIEAFYSAHNGGYSEDPVHVWGNADKHYAAQPDPYSRGVGGAQDQWKFMVSAPQLGEVFGLQAIDHIEVESFASGSGRIQSVILTDRNGARKSLSGRDLVRAFYPYGQPISAYSFLGNLFAVEFLATASAPEDRSAIGQMLKIPGAVRFTAATRGGPRIDRVISSSEGLAPVSQPYGVYVFRGSGWGHGVGMSQWGAYHMAQMGFSFREILQHYYQHTQIRSTEKKP
jgi:stage II sporulation protein D